ncbi:MAG: TAXI family TRAP transporter solute-binding subunit [Lawsonibacter sp.]|jgi:TRAP transporter TAXI family solute receptor
MKKKLALVLAAAMALSLALTGCGNSNQPSSGGTSSAGGSSAAASTPSGEKTTISLATGSTSANYYAIGGVMSTVLNPVLTKSNITVTSTGASKANVQLMQDNECNMGIIQNDVSYYAYTGTDLFDGESPYEDWGALCTMYDEVVQVFTLNPDIKSFADLKGKTVSVGAAGSGDNFAAGQIFAEFGMTFDDVNPVYQSYSDSAEGMKDGKIDAAFCVSGAPTTALVDLAATANKPLNIITLEDEHIEGLMADYPFYAKTVIPSGTYDGLDRDVTTVSIRAMLVARNDVSEDVVYELMQAMFDNMDSLRAGHAKFENMSLETVTDGVSIPYHAGAKKYLADNGVTVE